MSDAVTRMMAAFQAGQDARMQQELAKQREEAQKLREKIALEDLKLARQRADMDLKEFQQQAQIREADLREAATNQMEFGQAPGMSAADAGIQQAVPDVGPSVQDVQVPQRPTSQIESITGGPPVVLQHLFKPEVEAEQQRMADMEAQATANEEFAKYSARNQAEEPFKIREYERQAQLDLDNDIRALSMQRERDANAMARKRIPRNMAAPQQYEAALEIMADGWRDFNVDNLTENNMSVRSGLTQSDAKILAKQNGKKIPSRKLAEATLAAKAQLSDVDQIMELARNPVVREWIGAYKGRLTDFLAEGWLEPLKGFFGGVPEVPPEVWNMRAALGRANAEERNKVYGAAISGVELPLSRSWIPSMNQSPEAFEAALAEAKDNIVRGLDAQWGTEPPPEEPPEVNIDSIAQSLASLNDEELALLLGEQ